MPRIRRWFHVSHDINADGEVWELTDRFGVAGLRLWLELLSIADRNDGKLPALSDSSVRQLSIKCNSTQTRVRLVLDFCQTRLWVVSDPSPRIRNWLIYNPSREDKKSQTSSPPILPLPSPSDPIKKENLKRKKAYPEGFQVSEEVRTWAKAKGLPDPTLHLEAFRDHHVSHRSTFADWDAALRTWMRNVARFGRNGRRPEPDRPRPVPPLVKPGPIAAEPSPEERTKVKGLLSELTKKLPA